MENEMKIVAWKQNVNEDEQPVYKLQLEGKFSSKERKKILSELEDWKEVGYGWHKKGKSELRLFSRTFQDKDSWVVWAKEFPFELREVNRNGKAKKIN
tara:strand:+ start:1829 stop:2122 length:294 start_codon:yes stop_codon:yes gene_type:complete